MKTKIWVALWLFIAVVSCGTTGVKSKLQSLDSAITDYHVSLRWAMLDKVEAYHRDKNGEHRPLDRASMERVRVTGYTIFEQQVNPETTEAVIRGEVSYYTTDTGILRKQAFTHVWWYSEEAKRWFNSSDYPQLK